MRFKLRFDRKLMKRTGMIGAAVLLLGLAALPFLFGTSTYPVSVVQGNSMYPTLQNGDLVLFQAAPERTIANGTIVVFVQTGTGQSLLDSLLKPVLIHRIVGVVMQGDGKVNYQTKGDNNIQADPGLVPADRILGTPAVVVPKAGFIVLFVQSPQGLVSIVALIAFVYLGSNETRMKKEEEKEKFLGALAQMSLNGELSERVFEKFELAVKYVQNLELENITDGKVLALVDWVKKGGLDSEWKVMRAVCPNCHSRNAANFEGSNGLLLTVCPICTY